jgi:hypothetical protein
MFAYQSYSNSLKRVVNRMIHQNVLTHLLTHSLTHLLTYSLTHLGVCFTGHSLGGAVASGIFFKYHMYVPNPLDTLVVTLGSPQMLKKNMPTKVSWHPGTALAYSLTHSLTYLLTYLLPRAGLGHDVDLNKLESKCHHIVQRYDITPRIVGPHELPSSFYSIPLIGDSLKSFASTLNRDTFCCYGIYSLTHLLTYLLTYSLTHSLTYSLTYLLT